MISDHMNKLIEEFDWDSRPENKRALVAAIEKLETGVELGRIEADALALEVGRLVLELDKAPWFQIRKDLSPPGYVVECDCGKTGFMLMTRQKALIEALKAVAE